MQNTPAKGVKAKTKGSRWARPCPSIALSVFVGGMWRADGCMSEGSGFVRAKAHPSQPIHTSCIRSHSHHPTFATQSKSGVEFMWLPCLLATVPRTASTYLQPLPPLLILPPWCPPRLVPRLRSSAPPSALPSVAHLAFTFRCPWALLGPAHECLPSPHHTNTLSYRLSISEFRPFSLPRHCHAYTSPSLSPDSIFRSPTSTVFIIPLTFRLIIN